MFEHFHIAMSNVMVAYAVVNVAMLRFSLMHYKFGAKFSVIHFFLYSGKPEISHIPVKLKLL